MLDTSKIRQYRFYNLNKIWYNKIVNEWINSNKKIIKKRYIMRVTKIVREHIEDRINKLYQPTLNKIKDKFLEDFVV